ncbi:MAG: excinuclease ABC subunit UvrC [Deltaproteobacteria bacterium]|nr:excinuclease ABC subunit UvrC [Deltaproteobacteria bacterium]
MLNHLHEKLSGISSDPGVYLMKDKAGKVIYVGKASNLKKRLTSYFKVPDSRKPDLKTQVLITKISTFDTLITASEQEALILESNLIKRYLPRYNVILKDDKRYPSLRLDVKNPYPCLTLVRKIANDGALYFGPFASSQAVRRTLKFINKTFKLRKCKTRDLKNRLRPCLNYQMGTCLAPCCLEVDENLYTENVKEVVLFLKGRTPDLIRKIKKEMTAAARVQDYEKAALLRDKFFALEKTLEKQVAVTTDLVDRDVLAVVKGPDFSLITLLFLRGGFLLGNRHFTFKEAISSDEEIIGAFLRQYYENARFVPKEVLVPILLEDSALFEEWLKSLKGEKVSIFRPVRGEKARLVEMAVQNAKNELENRIASDSADRDILSRLQKRLKISSLPVLIECFDISNISGTDPVAGMVVFENGKPHKSSYRKYRIKTVEGPNDYACMHEVLKRRYGKGERSRPFPDLLMVDGGKGQINIAVSVLKELNIEADFEIIGIAKKDETKGETEDKIYKPGRANPVNLGREGDLLFLLQRIRDETHRFAITFHRKRRSKRSITSALDAIPGIGRKRKKTLLKHFGSIKKIRAATLEELSALPGMNRKAAEAVRQRLAT